MYDGVNMTSREKRVGKKSSSEEAATSVSTVDESDLADSLGELDLADGAPSDDFMHSQILSAIIERQLPAGTKLPEESLAQAFRVSRTRVRKVLARLVLEKIVVLTRNKGATVAEPNLEDLLEVFTARRLVELGPVRMLCCAPEPEAVNSLRALVEKEKLARLRGDTGEALKLSGGFHLKIAQATGNRIVSDLLGVLISRTTLFVSDVRPGKHGLCDIHEHQHIFEAIEKGDSALAVQLMDDHLKGIHAATVKSREHPEEIDLFELFNRPQQ